MDLIDADPETRDSRLTLRAPSWMVQLGLTVLTALVIGAGAVVWSSAEAVSRQGERIEYLTQTHADLRDELERTRRAVNHLEIAMARLGGQVESLNEALRDSRLQR